MKSSSRRIVAGAVLAGALWGWLPGVRGQVLDPLRRPSLVPVRQEVVEAELLADRTALVPGASIELAVRLQIDKGWHIYGREPGETGLPTAVEWKVPTGFEIGSVRFPRSREYVDAVGTRSLILEGEPAILAELHAPADAKAGEPVMIGADVSWLACKEACIPGHESLALSLPVVADASESKPANEPVFEAARAAAEEAGGGFTLDSDVRSITKGDQYSLLGILGLALLAGFILNVTPCVLPVISIKVLSFVQQASESPAKVFKLGLAFSLGMLLAFNVLAVLATGLGLVWGQHFQSPVFTVVMAAIVFAFGLSLFGVFTLGVPRVVGDAASRADTGEGYAGSVAKGVLATAMGTPCIGPFLGSVLVWASAQPAGIVFVVFNTIGVGMALPYVLLTANPRWLRFVPKSGPWLETFKQAMGFLLAGTVVYLLYILNGQLGGLAVVWALAFLVGVGLACWIVGTWVTLNVSRPRRAMVMLIAVGVIALSGWLAFGVGLDEGTKLPWVEFSMDRLTTLTGEGRTVFLDITADWCPNCKYNLAAVFNTEAVAEAVEEYDVVPMLADWTARDNTTRQLIDKLAPGASVPLCAVFPAGRPDEPIVMLGIVTKAEVIEALWSAAGK